MAKKFNSYSILYLMVFFIATTLVLGIYSVYRVEDLRIAKDKITNLQSTVKMLNSINTDLKTENHGLIVSNNLGMTELNSLRSQNRILNDISKLQSINSKNYDDQLKNAIVTYIKKYYSRSSTIVAGIIADNIITLSNKHNIAPDLIVATMEEESWFNPQATNKKSGAIGLMQVMEEWIPKFKLKNRKDLYEIDINIESGIKVLKIHIKENKGSISKGLYHYVNGSKSYVDKVYRAMGRFTIHRASLNQLKGIEKND